MITQKATLRSHWPYLFLGLFFLLAPVAFTTRAWLNAFISVFIAVVGTVSLRTISLSGNMSFAHAAFMGVGAYVAGILSKELGLTIWLTVPIGALSAMVLGLITGWPFARLRSIYFCMGSMFMGVAIVQFISAFKITGGAIGLRGVKSLSSSLSPIMDTRFGSLLERLGWSEVQLCYYLFFIVTVVILFALYRFEHSRIGWTLRALSQSPDVAASTGINETYFRLLSVAVGCFSIGLIGALNAHYSTTLSPNSFGMSSTLWLIMSMMIGGQHVFLGPIVGAIVIELVNALPNLLTAMTGNSNSETFIAFSRWLGNNAAYTPFLTAAVLLVAAYFIPGGLVSIPSMIRDAVRRRREKRTPANTEGGDGDAA